MCDHPNKKGKSLTRADVAQAFSQRRNFSQPTNEPITTPLPPQRILTSRHRLQCTFNHFHRIERQKTFTAGSTRAAPFPGSTTFSAHRHFRIAKTMSIRDFLYLYPVHPFWSNRSYLAAKVAGGLWLHKTTAWFVYIEPPLGPRLYAPYEPPPPGPRFRRPRCFPPPAPTPAPPPSLSALVAPHCTKSSLAALLMCLNRSGPRCIPPYLVCMILGALLFISAKTSLATQSVSLRVDASVQ